MVSVNYLAYKNALKQAWKDGKMSADESAMLDTLRKSLNISADEHVQIEQDVRSELAGMPNNSNDQVMEPTPNNNINNNNFNNNNNPQEIVQPEAPPPPEQVAEPAPAPPQAPAPPPEQAPPEPAEAQGEATDETDIKSLLVAGKNSYHKGNYEEAIEYCDKVLLLDPDNSEALFFRKRTLSKIEKLRGKKDTGASKAKGGAKEVPDAKTEVEPPDKGGEKTGGGDPNCKSCKGSGECHWCKKSGECYWCKGSGKCDKCGGTGKIADEECKSCKGTGKCHSCNGDGKCYWCNGSGKCSKCSL